MTDSSDDRAPATRSAVHRSSSTAQRRVRAVLLAATLVVLSLALPSSAAPRTCGVGGTYEGAGRGWLALRPEFPAGPKEVTAFVSPAFRPDTIYATNGRVLMRTVNGCDWTKVLDIVEWMRVVTGVEPPLPSPRILALTAPSASNTPRNLDYIYVAAEQYLRDGSPRPFVLSSTTGGTKWLQGEKWVEIDPNALPGDLDPSTAAARLPAVGRIRELAVGGRVPDTAYVVVEVPGAEGATTALYSTGDAGLTWQRRTPPQESLTVRGIVVDPTNPRYLVGLKTTGDDAGFGTASDDSGTRFDQDFGPAVEASDLAVAFGEKSAQYVFGHRGTKAAYLVDRGGSSRFLPTPVVPVEVAIAPLRTVIGVTDGTRLVVLGPRLPALDVTPSKRGFGSFAFGAPTERGTALTGVADGAVLRAVLDLTTFRLKPVKRPVVLLPGGPPQYFPPILLPQDITVSLPAGGTEVVPYTLILPRTPTPIDVMFLVDSTESMQPVIDGLRQSMAAIVNGLVKRQLDVQFGVGDFRDIPPPGEGDPGDYPYKLRRVIGPADDELADAIASINAGGGNGATSGLIAAHQAVTGSGWRVADGKGPMVVDPGQDAKFRPGTVRLEVIATDIQMRQVAVDYGTIKDTAKALRKHDVRAIGLALDRGARPDLEALARQSGALAPPGGIDCDGDGANDIPEGAPLVCDVDFVTVANQSAPTPLDLAQVIEELVEGVTDKRPISVEVTGATVARAAVVGGSVLDTVNLKVDNTLPFSVRFSCPRLPQASRHELTISAGPDDGRGARATATVECAAAPVRTEPPEIIVVPPGPRIAPPAPPGPPPPNPVPNVNPNPNPHPGLNVNVGMADQREEQFQLALAENDEQADAEAFAEESLAMSSRREADPALLLGPAALLVASAAWAAGRRTAARAAPVRR